MLTNVGEAEQPSFPPLLRGEEAAGDCFALALARAREGADPGLVTWSCSPEVLRAAIVLAPEDPLGRAAGILLAAPLALGDALAALAPPEVALHYDWPGGIRVNGASCGHARAAADTSDGGTVPAWLVLGIEARFLPPPGLEGGERRGETCLHAEGCGEVRPVALLEGWARHMLLWTNRWTELGTAALAAAWRARAWGLSETLAEGGTFEGIDEHGAMLVRTPEGTRRRPLTAALEQ